MDFTAKHLFVNRRVKMLQVIEVIGVVRSQLGVTVETQASLLAMTTTVAICALVLVVLGRLVASKLVIGTNQII